MNAKLNTYVTRLNGRTGTYRIIQHDDRRATLRNNKYHTITLVNIGNRWVERNAPNAWRTTIYRTVRA